MTVLLIALLAILAPTPALAEIVNIELKFTPYTGQPAKQDKVETVPGIAAIFINGVPFGQQEVRKESVPVQFEEREIAPAVWMPVDSLGPAIRKGKNVIRIEFIPSDPEATYRARLSWASVTDQETDSEAGGKRKATNEAKPGKEEKTGKGRMVLEHEIWAHFANEVAWHHYPAVTALEDADKQKLTALVLARGGVFAPDFKKFYAVLAADERVEVAKLKETKCVEAAYTAGVRLDAPSAEQLDFLLTGNPEVVIRRKGGVLFKPADLGAFEKIEGQEAQMCAGIALSMVFPPQLVVVKSPEGEWQVVY